MKDCSDIKKKIKAKSRKIFFIMKVGLPAKSGVAGGVLLVVPNVMGVCLWSPPLDVTGNSVRGLQFCDVSVYFYAEKLEADEHTKNEFRHIHNELPDLRSPPTRSVHFNNIYRGMSCRRDSVT